MIILLLNLGPNFENIWEHTLDILADTVLLDCTPVDIPMDPNIKLVPGQEEHLRYPERYR